MDLALNDVNRAAGRHFRVDKFLCSVGSLNEVALSEQMATADMVEPNQTHLLNYFYIDDIGSQIK